MTYIPMDRRQAMARGQTLPERMNGAALFADISGFTSLTETLTRELGPRRGAEELTNHLNQVYDALITALHRYGGSVIGFSGDAITCWLDGDDGRRAVAVALAMQAAMQQFAEVRTHSGRIVSLGMKAAIAAGPVRRFVVGDPEYCLIDVMAGATLEHLAAAEHHGEHGEVILDAATVTTLRDGVQIAAWREDERTGDRFAVVTGLTLHAPETPWPPLPPGALRDQQVRPWLLPSVYELAHQEAFLAELRPAVALFLRFGGIDYDRDEDATEKLTHFIRQVEEILRRYDGSLIQVTLGDKGSYLYAAFGAPVAHEDDAVRAASAALELRTLAGRLDFLTPPQIGITQGRMRTGAYGSTTRRTYGVLGDDTNLSARLMLAAEPGEILVSQPAREAAGDAFAWEERPPIKVKGKSEPVAIAQLVGPKEQRAIRLLEPRYALPMVGREAEVALLRAKMQLARHGQGQVVGLTAEAGMGKSRLAAEAIRLASEQGLAGFGGECQSYGTNTSYLPWHTIWRGLFGLEASQSPAEQIETLEARLERINPAFVPRLPLLGPVLNLPIHDNDFTRTFDAKLRKSSLEALLVDSLRTLATEQPLLLVLEDCHWLDPLSHDLIEQIGRAIAELPVFMLLVYRPPDPQQQAPRVSQLPYFTRIMLAEFTPEEAGHLIRLKLAQFLGGTASVPPGFVEQITERAAGNPFYIEELLNYLRDRAIDPQDRQVLAALDLPASLHSLILTRIDHLSERQQTTIKVASVIGRLFRPAMVWGIYPELGQPQQVENDLQILSSVDLTQMDTPHPELTYLFKHVITQQVAYESLLYATRAMLHNQIGLFIEKTYQETLDQYVDLLAHHYDHSDNEDKKREYLLKAGDAAQGAYANSAAIDYYQRALPLLPEAEQVPVLLKLGQVLELVGQWHEAEEADRRALALAEDLQDLAGGAQAQRALGWLLRKRGDYPGAEAWLKRAQASFRQLSDAAGVSHVLADIGEVYRLQTKYAEARGCYDESLALAAAVAEPELRLAARAHALKGAGTLATWQGDYATARTLNEESLASLREVGDKPGIAALINNLGIVALFQRDLEAAHRMNDQGLALFRELGDQWSVGTLLNNQACVASDRGDYREARRLLRESMAIGRQLGAKAGLALSLNTLADVVLDEGDYASARPLLDESLLLNLELGDRTAIAYLLEDYGGLAAAEAQPDLALRLAGFAAALRATIGAPLPPAAQARVDRMLNPARRALDEAAAAAAWAAGQAMTLDEAILCAIRTHPS